MGVSCMRSNEFKNGARTRTKASALPKSNRFHVCLRERRRKGPGGMERAPAKLREHVQIEEMHHAEHHEDQTHLAAKNLHCGLGIYRFGPIFQSQSNETDINEIKTDDQQ